MDGHLKSIMSKVVFTRISLILNHRVSKYNVNWYALLKLEFDPNIVTNYNVHVHVVWGDMQWNMSIFFPHHQIICAKYFMLLSNMNVSVVIS